MLHHGGVSDLSLVRTDRCSIYCPTPSMASMLINHFRMREDIQSYALGGMGCANGVIGVNMISDLLQAGDCLVRQTDGACHMT